MLIEEVGGQEVAGGKLKSTSTLWQDPNEGATNEFRFNGLPGGYRKGESDNGSAGDFSHMGQLGSWWGYFYQYGEGGRQNAVHYMSIQIGISYLPEQTGLSVRCVRGEQGDLESDGEPPYLL